MFYEVFIPARDSEEFDTTITVEAGNWMIALKSGLDRTGQLGDGIRNVMCDIKDDNSIHVTDGASRRVFVLKEVSEAGTEKAPTPKVPKPKLPNAPKIELDAVAKTEPMKIITESDRPKTASNVSVDMSPQIELEDSIVSIATDSISEVVVPAIPEAQSSLEENSYTSADGRISIGSATYESLKREDSEVKILREARAPSGTRPAVSLPTPSGSSSSSVSQNILEDVFLEMQQIHEGMEMEEVIEFVMNMSMDKIRAEAGSIMFADISGTELYFAAARGPKSEDIMDFRIPMGVGIVGFCVREGVSLAIGDVEKDPRFYKAISEKLGYETRNLCCVPIQHEGRVYGAIELMNKKEVFATQEVNALTYIGGQMARYIHDLIMAQEKI